MTKRFDHRPIARSAHHRLRALWLALVLGACGGGVDSGGTGNPTFASGTITGFGSVIVNEVHFDDSQASVTDADGVVHNRTDLRLGMTTDIRGSTLSVNDDGVTVSTASSIVFGSELLGPISAIDVTAKQLVVLGQTVDITPATVFDDASLGGGLLVLALGDVVEIYALADSATGHYAATRIERRTGVSSYVLRGVAGQLDTNGKTLNIGGQRFSYAGFGGTLPATLANGSIVRVRVRPTPVAGVWQVSALVDGVQRPRDSDEVRLAGLVTDFISATQFSVNGVAVDASALNATGVALGINVEVEGTANHGVLVASKVQVKSSGGGSSQEFQLSGQIASTDASSSSFVLRGMPIVYSAGTTRFDNGTATGLTVGATIDVRGTLSPDGTQLLATRIRFR
jgi:hypothetical protein